MHHGFLGRILWFDRPECIHKLALWWIGADAGSQAEWSRNLSLSGPLCNVGHSLVKLYSHIQSIIVHTFSDFSGVKMGQDGSRLNHNQLASIVLPLAKPWGFVRCQGIWASCQRSSPHWALMTPNSWPSPNHAMALPKTQKSAQKSAQNHLTVDDLNWFDTFWY